MEKGEVPESKETAHQDKEHHPKHHKTHHVAEENILSKPIIALIIIAAVLVLLNQFQISALTNSMQKAPRTSSGAGTELSLDAVDTNELKSTAHTLQAVFPIQDIQSQEDALAILFPTGTPEYGEALGVSFDDPVGSLARLARMYPTLKTEVQKNDPAAFQEFISLATKPVGISCEYCCGIGPVGINKNGDSLCGCQHNPALETVALYLTAYTDYSEAEVLREVMRWKTLFFPKNMIELGMKLGGGDTTVLENLPGMVGGC